MKVTRICFLLAIGLPTVMSAAQVYGSLKKGDRAVRQGVQIEVTCGNHAHHAGQTDVYGSYSINVRETGSCTLKVFYSDRCMPTFQIDSENEPVRYDFLLFQQSDTCVLQRR